MISTTLLLTDSMMAQDLAADQFLIREESSGRLSYVSMEEAAADAKYLGSYAAFRRKKRRL